MMSAVYFFVLAFLAYFLVYYFSPTGSGAISGNYINYKFIKHVALNSVDRD